MNQKFAPNDVWPQILNSIKSKLSQESYQTWFQPVRFETIDEVERVIHLGASTQSARDWINTNYSSVIDESLGDLGLSDYLIHWTIDRPTDRESNGNSSHPVTSSIGRQQTTADSPTPAGFGVGLATAVQREAVEPTLNSKYTYDTFVVGSCNQFAHAASSAVAAAPGKTYNPLYIYGGVGLGKTHLMHACGNAIKERNPHLQLCYLSSEKFMNELINSIRYDRTQGFRERYRSVDVLLIDDVQFMAGKERTQEEFFHTFNSLYEQQKQIVISSDCPPREIPTLEERLHSRFEWGLIADIEPPDLETKVAILKRKAETLGVNIPDDVALLVATRVKNNVRELEGSLVRIAAISSLRGVPITEALAKDAIRHIAREAESNAITIQKIQKAVADGYRIKVEELIAKGNARRCALPRQIAMFLCKKLTKHSYPEIGRAFGGKHHTTVIHSFEKIQSLIGRDTGIQKLVDDVSESLRK